MDKIILKSELFYGLDENTIHHILSCIEHRILTFNKGQYLYDLSEGFKAVVVLRRRNEFSNISNDIRNIIAVDLTKISCFKSIAESNGVSPNTIVRVFKEWNKSFKQDFSYIPPVLSIDEFKSTKNVSGAMSFICSNSITSEIIDILPDRRLFELDAYFLRFPRRVRDQVKIVICDIYSPYMELVKKVFKMLVLSLISSLLLRILLVLSI